MSTSQQPIQSAAHTQPDTKLSNMAAFAHIIEQYAIDGAFLWLLRSQTLNSTLYTVDDLAELDQRICGHLEGLQTAGELAWDICQQQLQYEEAGETFIAAVYAFQNGDSAKIKFVCETALPNPQMRKGLISAMGWIDEPTANFWINRFLTVADPNYLYLGLAASSVRRHDPSHLLTKLFTNKNLSEQPEVHSRALRLIGEIKRSDLIPALNQAMEIKDKSIQFWANWSAAFLGNAAAVNNLKPYILQDNEFKDKALAMAFNLLPVTEARKWISEIASDMTQNRTVITTTAILGDPHAIGWLIQQMNRPLYARLAGLSFNIITGIDLEQANLHKVVDQQIPNTDEKDFEDEAEDVDSDLPWPDPIKVKAYWEQQGQSLQIGQRYFMGQPVESTILKQVITTGNQFQRNAAALKHALTNPDEVLLNTARSSIK